LKEEIGSQTGGVVTQVAAPDGKEIPPTDSLTKWSGQVLQYSATFPDSVTVYATQDKDPSTRKAYRLPGDSVLDNLREVIQNEIDKTKPSEEVSNIGYYEDDSFTMIVDDDPLTHHEGEELVYQFASMPFPWKIIAN
jgi:hypothetical protein